MTWPHTRWDQPHGHEGEWSADCDLCRAEWIERRAAEITVAGPPHHTGRAYTYTEAEELAAAELAEQ